jgi:hypothetical protein
MSEKPPAKKAAPKKKSVANGAAKKSPPAKSLPTKAAPAKKVAAKTAVSKKTPPANAASTANGLYVVVSSLSVSVSPDQPGTEVAAAVCASFDEARQTAIDALVSAIEDAEHTLLRFKRASTLAELRGD